MAQPFAKAALPDVRDHLEMAGRLGPDAFFEHAGPLFDTLRQPGEMQSLIERLLSDDGQLAAIASRSYYHANSFLKLVLAVSEESAWKLRLHLWHPLLAGDRPPREDIHTHRWDFTTVLLLGEYNAREYEVGTGDDYHHYRYTPVRADQFFSLEALGSEQLAPVYDGVIPVGTVYHLDHRVLHSIARSHDGPTATVVLQGPTVRDSTDVYRTTPASERQGEGREVYVERPSVDQLRSELVQLQSWL